MSEIIDFIKANNIDDAGLSQEYKLKLLADSTTINVKQSEKIGFDLVEIKLADTIIGKIYEAQNTIKGTKGNPIVWTEGVWQIPACYYLFDDKRYLYVGLLKKADDDDHPTGNAVTDMLKGWRNGG